MNTGPAFRGAFLIEASLELRNLILFDDETTQHLRPLTYTRPIADLRVGILTILEKWERLLQGSGSYITQDYLTTKYPIVIEEDNLIVNATVLPNTQLARLVLGLAPNEALMNDGELVAARIPGNEFDALIDGSFADEIAGYTLQETPVKRVTRLTDVLQLARQELFADYDLLTAQRTSHRLSDSNTVFGDGGIFVEDNVSAEACVFNTTQGPIYLGSGVKILEGSLIKGPVALGANTLVKMGARLYGPCCIGPNSKVGGELKNVSMQANSNKGHDGYLGDSILGEWCNLGADTNTSNMKNNYSEVRLWNYVLGKFEPTGLQFCGLVMGDHSKCGINTMFNTGTVVGVSANLFGAGYHRNFIPSFGWGGPQGMRTYRIDKALETAVRVAHRRGLEFSDVDQEILRAVYEISAEYRPWDAV